MNYMPRYCISTGTDIFLTAEVINSDCIEIAVGNKDRINKIPLTINQYNFIVESIWKQLETNERNGDQER
jgi:hypothetical protein